MKNKILIGRNEHEDAFLFSLYAGQDAEKWQQIVNQDVFHKTYGSGKIIKIRRNQYGLIVTVRFWDKNDNPFIRDFPQEAFRNGYFDFDYSHAKFWDQVTILLVRISKDIGESILEIGKSIGNDFHSIVKQSENKSYDDSYDCYSYGDGWDSGYENDNFMNDDYIDEIPESDDLDMWEMMDYEE